VTAGGGASRQLVRRKSSSAVVDYVLEELFAGRLRPGDRIDLEEVGRVLGLSRIPVREALVILERDGIVSTRYHRGVYVEPFDAQSIMDDFEVFGLLSGVAVRRLAERHDRSTVAELQKRVDELRMVAPDDREGIIRVVREILMLEHRAGGSRRLRAELKAFTGFLPAVFGVGSTRSHQTTIRAHSRVVRAIAAGDGEKAAHYRLEDFRVAGRDVVRELRSRHVIR
jgi:DNA-binding GntR family transcriptional regulator